LDIWHGHLEIFTLIFQPHQDQMNVLVRIDCYLGALQFGLPWMFFPGCFFFVCGLLNNIWGATPNGGFPQQPWVFLLKNDVFCGVLGGITILGNPHIVAGRVLRHTLIFRKMVKGG